MSNQGKIYCAHCIFTGKKYIGQTVKNNLKYRITEHFADCVNHNHKFANALQKYGRDGFIWGVIGEYNISLLNEMEIYWIGVYNTFNEGYNTTTGGNQGREYCIKEYLVEEPSTQRKIIKNLSQYCRDNDLNVGHIHETLYGKRIHHKGYKLIPRTENEIKRYDDIRKVREDTSKKGHKGEKHPMFNKKHTDETKQKMLKRNREMFSKEYRLISPEGNLIIEKTTLREFCRKYGLDRKSLTDVIKGKAKHHKGWTIPKVA